MEGADPPGSDAGHKAFCIIGCIVVVAAPFIIYAARKPSWKSEDSEFAPFHWEENTTVPETGTTAATQTKQKPVNKNMTE